MVAWCIAGVTCVVRGAIRWAFDADVAIDFLCISPKVGDVINAAAAKQLINIKRLVFNVTPPFIYIHISQSAGSDRLRSLTPRTAFHPTTNAGWGRTAFALRRPLMLAHLPCEIASSN
jgi:hypothetical protein